ncbi:MAG TPA: hypothetical protein VJ983_03525, partial [candidate division Zixibacteria bacterium]|nr:hypothetical protein [candidate division Zixibacteria bacterium]
MPCRKLRTSVLAVVAILFCSSPILARSEATYFGADIPSRIFTAGSFIFAGSDSLLLNHRLLTRGTDYTYDHDSRAFVLSDVSSTSVDTLVVIYSAAPSWLKPKYGAPLPETGSTISGTNPALISPIERVVSSGQPGNVSISGAKSFRFTSQTSGGSNFGQSLDLSISGKLAHGMELTGAVSDRGYDPSYGTANSRLNELDKVNLRLTSEQLTAQVGDITL